MLVSPQLTTDIDNYRELLIEDDKKKREIVPVEPGYENALIFEKRKNEFLTKTKLSLQNENQKYQQDVIYLEGQNKLLTEENEHLKRMLSKHGKRSLDEMKVYQDRTLEMMEHINDLKSELNEMKAFSGMGEEGERTRITENKEVVLNLLRSQERMINSFKNTIEPRSLNPKIRELLDCLAQNNQQIIDFYSGFHYFSDFPV